MLFKKPKCWKFLPGNQNVDAIISKINTAY